MREGAAAGAGEDAALDDAVVGQLVVEDQVAGLEQVADGRLVGAVAGDEDDRVLRAEEVGDRPLQLAVEGYVARDQPAGRDARAEAVDGVLGGLVAPPDRPTCPA